MRLKALSAALCALLLVAAPTLASAQALTIISNDPNTGARVSVPLPGATASAAINISTSTTTQLVALAAAQAIYVTHFDVIAGGTGTIQFVYGTGANCGTGQAVLTGAYPLTAQVGIVAGVGLGAVLVVPAGNALCAVTVGAVQYSGAVSYGQF